MKNNQARDIHGEESVWCPVCGAENPEKIYVAPGEGPVGCDICLCSYDAWDYYERG